MFVKQEQFNAAMERYTSKSRYKVLGASVSIINISLQLYLVYRIWPQSIGAGWQILAFLTAYLLTDLINELVHMYMDNNDRYDSLTGPLIANSHYAFLNGCTDPLLNRIAAACYDGYKINTDLHYARYVERIVQLANTNHSASRCR